MRITIYRCKCHDNPYTVCPACDCQYCPDYWPACPRCYAGTRPRPSAVKPVKAIEAPVETASMSDAELFAYYKRTGLRDDVRFFLTVRMSRAIQAGASALLDALETRAATPADRKAYVALTNAWREMRLSEDMARNRLAAPETPCIGDLREAFEPCPNVADGPDCLCEECRVALADGEAVA